MAEFLIDGKTQETDGSINKSVENYDHIIEIPRNQRNNVFRMKYTEKER